MTKFFFFPTIFLSHFSFFLLLYGKKRRCPYHQRLKRMTAIEELQILLFCFDKRLTTTITTKIKRLFLFLVKTQNNPVLKQESKQTRQHLFEHEKKREGESKSERKPLKFKMKGIYIKI